MTLFGALNVVPSKVSAEPVANALELDAKTTPPDVNDVKPVPPLVVANVPARVTAPVVAVEGVKPVDPAEKLFVTVVDEANNVTTPELFL